MIDKHDIYRLYQLGSIVFVALFLFKYVWLLVHLVAYLLYQPANLPPHYKDSYNNVTVVLLTVRPESKDFAKTLQSVVAADCTVVHVVTTDDQLEQARLACEYAGNRVRIFSCEKANKREQLRLGLCEVRKDFVLLVDDHVRFEQPLAFINSILAPFENPSIGGVATGKRVERDRSSGRFSRYDILNFIACTYLERHNFGKSTTVVEKCINLCGRASCYKYYRWRRFRYFRPYCGLSKLNYLYQRMSEWPHQRRLVRAV